eukprot:2481385-Alexandrium_andersonii.AAC.1
MQIQAPPSVRQSFVKLANDAFVVMGVPSPHTDLGLHSSGVLRALENQGGIGNISKRQETARRRKGPHETA